MTNFKMAYMRTVLTGTLAAASLASALALPALAQTTSSGTATSGSTPAAPQHQQSRCQDGFDAGDSAGVRICHGKAGEWRLVTTDPAKSGAHEYTGTLTTDGKFTDVRLIRPESDDSASVDGEGNLNYDFKTLSGIDGVAFRAADGAGEITFNLSVDGQQMTPRQIFVGDKGRHPKNDPFTLHVHAGRVTPRASSLPAASPSTSTSSTSS